jgi:iron complex transport system ATP-binding protein
MSLPVRLDRVCLDTPAGLRLLDDISFAVEPSACCAVVGPNGAGKSTLLALVAGRLQPRSGAVRIGASIGGTSAPDRSRQIAVLTQSDGADPRLRVADYVALGRIPHRRLSTVSVDRAAVTHAMEVCDLRGMSDRTLRTLSGGERQRAHLARALAQQPGLLLLDEPTNHMDVRARFELLDLVRGLGITVVAVLHDLTLVPRFADQVVVLDGGRLEYQGPAEDALTGPRVARVFGMDLVRARHPDGVRDVLAFEPLAP